MRGMAALVGLALLAGLATAQERIDPEEAQKFAKIFVEHAAKVGDLQLKLEPNADKPYGLRAGQVGTVVIPDKRLSEEAIQKAGKEVTPVGQLWVRNMTAVVKDQPVGNDRLRIVTVTANDKDHPLPLFLLGVRKQADGVLELVIYAKDKEPLLALPLQKAEVRQEMPIELEGKGEGGRGTLTMNVLGKYQAQLPMAKQE